uniref:NADH-ubiquinone oxidoreductase chain 4 n=1 Tax=Salinator rhamphidia TaxID=981055 RepID=G8HR55_9GAST|nr:NADH dehydrogenase subunit 4 [Salinator rhamphidia]AEQ93897.1 NADH dehydrogenase subunit 4 [Salinator rhamphidia]
MLSLVYGMIAVCGVCWWGYSCTSFALITLISLVVLNQNFATSVNMMFSGSNLSGLMVFLSVLLSFLAIMSTPSEKSKSYLFWISVLGLFLVLAFSSANILLFYVFFEASLIPTLMLIIGWGYQPERLQAGSYMMLYTVTASLPLLAALVWRCSDSNSMLTCILTNSPFRISEILVVVVFTAFLVKLPMYSVHLWLPKAHVEAPLAGSMILAGILLKLGGYGLMQMNLCFSISSVLFMMKLAVAISMWGGLISTLMCLRQVDVKALVAYSSVGHMGIVTAGMLLDRSWGVMSATVTMVAHGLSSSAMFCLAYFTYEKIHSRNLPYMSGFLSLYPILSLFWFVFCCINMAAPGTLNLLGELLLVPALWSSSMSLVVVMGMMVFLSAAFNMYLYTSVNHGNVSKYAGPSSPLRSFEMSSLVAHLMPLVFIFKSSVFYVL